MLATHANTNVQIVQIQHKSTTIDLDIDPKPSNNNYIEQFIITIQNTMYANSTMPYVRRNVKVNFDANFNEQMNSCALQNNVEISRHEKLREQSTKESAEKLSPSAANMLQAHIPTESNELQAAVNQCDLSLSNVDNENNNPLSYPKNMPSRSPNDKEDTIPVETYITDKGEYSSQASQQQFKTTHPTQNITHTANPQQEQHIRQSTTSKPAYTVPKISANFDKPNHPKASKKPATSDQKVLTQATKTNETPNPKDINVKPNKSANYPAPSPPTITQSLATKLRARQTAKIAPIEFTPPRITTKQGQSTVMFTRKDCMVSLANRCQSIYFYKGGPRKRGGRIQKAK
ncbi:uncharacterized protein LOC107798602 [Nicotiana tabacum]|uniref:Uncharacterized protein LOC107798602 n=1 Tax=Nicotiana tabacum TaxID=4097 RepID=A0A1S4AKG5_TOBAC